MADIHTLEIDLDLKENLLVSATCKQLDNVAFVLNLWNDGQTIDLTNYEVELRAMKSDQVPLIQNTNITTNGNIAIVKGDYQLTTTSGVVECEIGLINKTTKEKKFSFDLHLKVVKSVFEVDRSISKATYTLLEQLENKIDEVRDIGLNLEEAKTVNTNLKANIVTGNKLDTDLKADIENANNSKSDLDTSKTNADNSKSALDTATSNANTKKQEIETATTNAETKKQEVITQIGIADTKIAKMESFGDASALVQDVTKLKADVASNTTSLSELAKKTDVIPIIDLKGQTIATHSIVETGIYKNASWTDYPSGLFDGQGELIVIKHSTGWVYQKFITAQSAYNFERKMFNSVWSAWKQIATTETAILTPLNGWVCDNSIAEAYKNGNIVTLNVTINGGMITEGAVLFNLPVGYRPTYNRNLPVICYSASDYIFTNCRAVVSPTGEVRVYNNIKNGLLIINASFGV